MSLNSRMEESHLALEAALRGKVEASSCDCVACPLAFKQKEAKVLTEGPSDDVESVSSRQQQRDTREDELRVSGMSLL